MIKFSKEVRRSTLQEFPLSVGSSILAFKEDENGKLFSELITEILDATSAKDFKFRDDLLARKYKISMTIGTAVDEETIADIRFGLNRLDTDSKKFRLDAAQTDLDYAKAQAQHVDCNLHLTALFDASELAQEFDYVNVDVSNLEINDVEKGLIYLVALSQRPNPTTYVISTELANEVETVHYKGKPIEKTLSSKIKIGSVFAKGDGLKNDGVRAI